MATAVVARPSQALRQRRESQRPSHLRASGRSATADANERSSTELPVPLVKSEDYILQKFRGKPPSLVIHLHPTHFRFDQQDGSFGYNSPMQIILKHIRDRTVPHEILDELFASRVTFYDGCLIVQVHDHRSGASTSRNGTSNLVGGSKATPFSVHNWNEHVTPSPYVPHPKNPRLQDPSNASPTKGSVSESPAQASSTEKGSDKENMPAPGQPASSTQKFPAKGAKVFTVVLFDTQLSLNEEMSIMTRTPCDTRSGQRKQANNRDGATPTVANPPTPLTSVPSTPMAAKGNPAKCQKMMLDDSNIHEFEAEVLLSQNPVLLLEPAKNVEESQKIMTTLSHSSHQNPPPAPKSRKRTTAELAADEAQAAEEERYMLLCDELHAPSLANGASGLAGPSGDGQVGTASFEPQFNRFKNLEDIRMRHEENEQRKKEEEARSMQAKKQQTADQELQKRKEMEARVKQEHAKQIIQQRQMEQIALQQQMQQQQAHNGMPGVPGIQHQGGAMASIPHHPLPQQTSQAQHASPIVRQQTPMASSPLMNGNMMPTPTMASASMAAMPSSQGAGSPPRPTSAVPHHPGAPQAMVRQMSQQGASQHGTPQMMHSTPSMGQAVPVTRHMTPQPRMNPHGSPVGGHMQGTPVMMAPTPQAQHPQLTEQQRRMILMQQHQQRQLQLQAQQGGMQGSPHQMSPDQQTQHQQQLAMMRAQAQMNQAQHRQQQIPMSQQPPPQQMNPAAMNEVYRRQMAMSTQARMAGLQNGGPMIPTGSVSPGANLAVMPNGQPQPQHMGPRGSQGEHPMGNPNQGQPMVAHAPATPLQAQFQQRQNQMKHKFNMQLQALRQQHNGNPPEQLLQQLQGRFQHESQLLANRMAQAQQAAANGGGGGGGGGGGTPVDPAYMAQLQQTRRNMAMMQGRAGPPQQGMVNGIGMQGMPAGVPQGMQGMQGLSMAQMQAMQQGMGMGQMQMGQMQGMGRGGAQGQGMG